MSRRSRAIRTGVHRSDQPRVVELAGAPGAGKTTLMPEVIDVATREGFEAFGTVAAARTLASRTRVGRIVGGVTDSEIRDRALWMVYLWSATAAGIRFIMGRPGLMAMLARQLRRPSEAMVAERHVIRWFVRYVGTERLFRRLGGHREVLVVDEGYAHRVVQLFTSAVEQADPAHVGRYLALVPAPELLITVSVLPEVALERLANRGVWDRMTHLDDSKVAAFVLNASAAVECAEDRARWLGWTVRRVDNSVDGVPMRLEARLFPEADGGHE